MTRERRALAAAVLLSGAAEVTDFLLPLFAGARLGVSPATIGLLLAAELAVSLLVRPVAGVLADRRERRSLAAFGAFLYAAACAGYALAGGVGVAFAAAVVGGAGGALLWVSLRAMIGERLGEDSGVFAKLLSAEEYGGWVVFVPAVVAVGVLGYTGTFAALAACCLAGAAVLLAAPRAGGTSVDTPAGAAGGGAVAGPGVAGVSGGGGPSRPLAAGSGAAGGGSVPSPGIAGVPSDKRSGLVAEAGAAAPVGRESSGSAESGLLRSLSPMLGAVVLTSTAESAIGLLLLLHLQTAFHLPPAEIAMVFLPGAIAMSVLPAHLHRWVTRLGRARMVALASVSSAAFAASLAAAPEPAVVGVAWVLTAAAWAVILPMQQAVVSEVAGPARLGRGLGWYESATLAGGVLGSLAAGFLYRSGWWAVACLVCAGMILAGAVVGPAAMRRLGVADKPPAPAETASAPAASAETGFAPAASAGLAAAPAASAGSAVLASPGTEPGSSVAGHPRPRVPGPARAPGGAVSAGARDGGSEVAGERADGPEVGLAASSGAEPAGGSAVAPDERRGAAEPPKSRRRLVGDAALHVAAFAIALVVAAKVVAGLPVAGVLGLGGATVHLLRVPGSVADLVAQGLRLWWIVLLVDLVWTVGKLFSRRR